MIRRLGAALLGVVLVASIGTLPAQAADDYQASIVASIGVDVDCPVAVGSRATAVATVSIDGAARAALGGRVAFALNGAPVTTVPLNDNDRARAVIPASMLPAGDHTLQATYQPAAGSDLQPVSAQTLLKVNADGTGTCVAGDDDTQGGDDPGNGGTDGPKAGQSPSGGLLPNTGGFWLGLLAIALIALAGGAVLVRRGRNA